jgi:hypothetical protein
MIGKRVYFMGSYLGTIIEEDQHPWIGKRFRLSMPTNRYYPVSNTTWIRDFRGNPAYEVKEEE